MSRFLSLSAAAAPAPRTRLASFFASLFLQAGAVALLFTLFAVPAVQVKVRQTVTLLLPPDIAPAPVRPTPTRGGGGGGDRSPLPAGKGRLPRAALRQFVPPSAVQANPAPRLAMEPAILASPDVALPPVDLRAYGDPLGRIGPPSNGNGSGGGIGSGRGGGVGSGSGGGAGQGEGGGFGGGVYAVGGNVIGPVAVYSPGPEYSDPARRAHLEGTVVVELVVDPSGSTRDWKVIRPLGLGLDEQAVKAVASWRFKPATRNGKPVAVLADVYVGFHLL